MSYIGNQPLSSAFLTDTFSGNNSTTAFTMTVAPANTSSCIVAVTGVLQDPSTYSVSGTTLTFSAAPPTGTNNISVRYLGIPASGVTNTAYRTVTDATATAGQTTFSIPSYTVGYVDVFRNGVRLPNADYTASNGTTVVLVNGCTVGDTITTVSFFVSSVLNAIPNSPASVGDTNIVDVSASKLTGSRTIPKGTMPAGSVLQVVNATYATQVSSSTNTFVDSGLTATITPLLTTSKILILISQNGIQKSTGSSAYMRISLNRNSTIIATPAVTAGYTGTTSPNYIGSVSIDYLDSPATTSAVVYKTQFKSEGNVAIVSVQGDGESSTITLMEIAA